MAKKILLADDSITIQKVIELTFSDEDFDVITVGNGRLALERLAEVRPDVVLCDIIMPEKDGYEVCEQIKSNPQWSHVPVLLLTGAFEPFDQERASRAGYDGSLAKPFEPETLIAKVKDLLARAPRPAAPTPSTPPIVPFARPTAAVPPPMPGLPPLPPPVISGGFITDEPFPEAEEPRPSPPAAAAAPPLAPLSPEESRMLSGPAPAEEASSDDSASTVMFRPSELPWADAPAATPLPASAPSGPIAMPTPVAAEPLHAPAPVVEVAEEPQVFEAVLEEDLDFGPAGFESAAGPAPAGGETLFSPETTTVADAPSPTAELSAVSSPEREVEPEVEVEPAPAREEITSIDDLVSGAPDAPAEPEPSFVEEEALEPEPEPPPSQDAAETARVSDSVSAFAVFGRPLAGSPSVPTPEPAPEPEPEPLPEPEPPLEPPVSAPPAPAAVAAPVPVPAPVVAPAAVAAPPEAPAPAPAPEPVPAPAAMPGPFADLDVPAEPPSAAPESKAGAIPVPVDMVEKIAQRVVAQISEKVVREIAWEVIPDLAEALIKQEIERLKAELQKT